MNCPSCGFRTSVLRTTSVTVRGIEIKTRVLTCGKGHRSESQEQITPALNATGTVESTVESTVRRSVSGSDPDPCLSLVADPDPALNPDLGVDHPRAKRRKGRGDAFVYGAEFEAFWAACHGKKGNKLPAFKAWQTNNPPQPLTIERWALWMTTDQWRKGFSQHLSTWLNERGWENEPDRTEYGRPPERDIRKGWAPPSTHHPRVSGDQKI